MSLHFEARIRKQSKDEYIADANNNMKHFYLIEVELYILAVFIFCARRSDHENTIESNLCIFPSPAKLPAKNSFSLGH